MTSDRNTVLAAAQRCLNADPTASLTAVARGARVSRATLHRHFESREALLIELGTRSLDRWELRMNEVGLEQAVASADPIRLRSTLEALVLLFVDDSEDFGFALTDSVILATGALQERKEQLAEREAVLFAAAQTAGILRSDLPRRWIGHALYGLLVAGRDAVRLGDIGRRDAGDIVLASLLTGVSQS